MPENITMIALVDEKESDRVNEMVIGTWEDVQTGVSTYRRAKRGLITYFHTHIQNITATDNIETVVSIGTGIAIAVLSSAVIAASVGTLGALPVSMVVAGLVALISKKIFDAVRSKFEKDTLLAWLEKFSNGVNFPDPSENSAKEDEYLAIAIIHEYAKDYEKIQKLIPKVAVSEGKTEQVIKRELRKLYKDHPELVKVGNLTNNYIFAKYPKYEALSELVSRLHRTENYSKWLDAYFLFQSKRAKDFAEDEKLKYAEEFIMKEALFQASQSGLHSGCSNDLCLSPGSNDLIRRDLTPQQRDDMQKRSMLAKKLINPAERSGLISKMTSTALSQRSQIDLEITNDGLFSEVKEIVKEVVIDAVHGQATEEAGDLVQQNISGALSGTAGSAAALAPVGLLVAKSVQALIQYTTETKPLKEKIGVIRKKLHKENFSEDDFKSELKKIFSKDVGGYAVTANIALRALNLAVRHYPGRIKDRLDKLIALKKILKERRKDNIASCFSSCSEAHKAVQHILKVHHYNEKMIVNLALVRLFSDQLKKKIYHES
jgi:hypothetical protein